MALIALNTVNHNNVLFAPGQHVDATGADRDRLIKLGCVEEQDDRAAEKASKLLREEDDAEKAREAQKTADEAKAVADKLALASKPA